MSNSPLVTYTKISPNRTSPRQDTIKKITIHHMAGNLSIETCGNVFAPASKQVSSNYGIGSDGRIGMYVEEKDRSWCSSSRTNDHQAITIEVADDGGAPNWHVSDKAIASLIKLCIDICQRNGIKKLVFTGDANGNVTLHHYFSNTTCPGPYLESKIPYIVSEVNKVIAPEQPVPVPPTIPTVTLIIAKPTLKKGAKGTEVKNLQNNLNSAINAGLVVDGSFGNATESAVKAFQKKYGLSVDGSYGPKSAAKMADVLGKPGAAPAAPQIKAGTVTAKSGLNVRKGPGSNYAIVKVLAYNSKVNILENKNGWIKIAEGQYVSSTYIKV